MENYTYFIATAGDMKGLAEEVNHLIDKGYMTEGGIAIDSAGTFYQGMLKPIREGDSAIISYQETLDSFKDEEPNFDEEDHR
ncbi:MAG: hypothetical protein EOO14_02035 [Chitinophagaceae bacterium]|nr:MAG: hypothetical protein EOO14_02035 [Chitinophagaceae bacterium]